MSKWRPISEAPKDGTKVVVFNTREELREKVARALCWNRAGPACDCRASGIPCRGRVENLLDESSEFSKQADAAIALVLEEAARVAESNAPACQDMEGTAIAERCDLIAAAIRAMKGMRDE